MIKFHIWEAPLDFKPLLLRRLLLNIRQSLILPKFFTPLKIFPHCPSSKMQPEQKWSKSSMVKFNFWQRSNSCYRKPRSKIICFRYEESIFAILIVEAGRKNFPSATYLAYFDVFSATVALQINIKSLGLDLQALAHELFVPFGIKPQNKTKIRARKSREI